MSPYLRPVSPGGIGFKARPKWTRFGADFRVGLEATNAAVERKPDGWASSSRRSLQKPSRVRTLQPDQRGRRESSATLPAVRCWPDQSRYARYKHQSPACRAERGPRMFAAIIDSSTMRLAMRRGSATISSTSPFLTQHETVVRTVLEYQRILYAIRCGAGRHLQQFDLLSDRLALRLPAAGIFQPVGDVVVGQLGFDSIVAAKNSISSSIVPSAVRIMRQARPDAFRWRAESTGRQTARAATSGC